MKSKIEKSERPFDLEAFEREFPVLDPFAERVNEREEHEAGQCWSCVGKFDIASGRYLGEADPNAYEIAEREYLCSDCKSLLSGAQGFIFS